MISFEDMLKQMDKQMDQEEKAFSITPEKRLEVKHPELLVDHELTDIEREMIQTIQESDQYAWSKAKYGSFTTGFNLFDQVIEHDLQSGLIILAADPNVGKSAFMLQLLKQVSEKNEDCFCEYYSLDDNKKKMLPRYIANDQLISINEASNPSKYANKKDLLDKRNEGLKHLYENIGRFSLRDDTGDGSSTLEALEDRIKKLMMNYPNKRIILGIDSYFDLTTRASFNSDNREEEEMAKKLKGLIKQYDITIFCTAHLRKTNGNRPNMDDLKGMKRLQFEADIIGMLYNEVGIHEEAAEVYWTSDDEELKMPVLEMKIVKNKMGSFKGTHFYNMTPKYSQFVEATPEACRQYSARIYG
jgi:replicative DNA helicase